MPTVQCPNCRNSVDSAQTFCPECGTRITASLPPSANEPTQMLPRPGDPPSYGGQYGQPGGAPTYPPPGQYGQPGGAPTYPPPPGQYGQPSGGAPGSYPPPSGQYGQQPGYPPPGGYQQPGYGGYPPPGGSAPKSKTPLIVGGVVGVLVLGGIGYAVSQGGGGGTSTPTTSSRTTAKPTAAATRPKPTTKPTEEPTEVPTPETGFGTLPGSSVILDDFSDKRERWPETDPFEGDAYRYVEGAYQIQVVSEARILWTGTSTNDPYSDIHARLDVSFVEGPETNAAGLTLREQDAGGMYVFQLSPSGSYAFRRRDPGATGDDGEWTNVIDWTETSAIKTGLNEVNQIEIRAIGSSFTLIINGEEVDVAIDDTYTSGAVGFGASSFDAGGTLAQFDNLEITEP